MKHEADTVYGDCEKNIFHQDVMDTKPSICEYEHRNETRALRRGTTDPTQYTLYVHYTCGCVYCSYPERECRVKQP
jgi:hypothetical protein